ncbi:hypothetical protein EVAR_88490_1 [Eumeta japonica]|uniref:Uncharacterized protein n=1 Tax=Eumeta variegata TaxID=151549 RepID=A0A4C1XTC7_EUMVA|nr:hypothetical protein EVAR_88490_1 [Eumeta japonica]
MLVVQRRRKHATACVACARRSLAGALTGPATAAPERDGNSCGRGLSARASRVTVHSPLRLEKCNLCTYALSHLLNVIGFRFSTRTEVERRRDPRERPRRRGVARGGDGRRVWRLKDVSRTTNIDRWPAIVAVRRLVGYAVARARPLHVCRPRRDDPDDLRQNILE